MSELKKINRLYFDLEVSPNLGAFWRPGYNQNISHDQILQEREILTAAWKWEHKRTVQGMQWDWNGEVEYRDVKIIKKLTQVLTQADEVVTQNGKNFDEKWLRTRAVMLGLPPLPEFRHVDILQRHKRHFNFNSNTQDYLSKLIVGEGKPGMRYKDWIDMWYYDDRKAGKKMLAYNKDDVIKMEKIDQLTRLHEPQKINQAILSNYDGTCPECSGDLIKNGKYNTQVYEYQRYLCQDCRRTFRMLDKRRLKGHK